MKSNGMKNPIYSLFAWDSRNDIKFFLFLSIAGAATSYLNVRIPHTPALIDGRWIFGFMAFALIRRLPFAFLVACILSLTGTHTLPITTCFIGNMLYALPALFTVRLVHRRWLSEIDNLFYYFLSWLLMVVVIYQLFITPVVWAVVGIVHKQNVVMHVIEGWQKQPYLFEYMIVGILSAAGMSVIKSYEQLIKERSELDITLDSIGDGVIVTDTETRVKRINPEACNIIGISMEDAIDRKLTDFLDIFSSITGKPVNNPVKVVLEQGKVVGLANSTSIRTMDGRIRQIADSASPIYDHLGRLLGVVMVFRDVTEEYLAREEMKKKDILIQNSQRIGRVGSWEHFYREKRLIWSDEVCNILGCEPEGVPHTYRLFIQTVHPDDRDAVKTAFRESITKRITKFQIEHRIVRTDNKEIRYVVLIAQNNRNQKGRLLSTGGMIQDITERKKAELSLIKSEKMYHELFTSSRDGIVVLDNTGRFISANKAYCEMLGYSPVELQGFASFADITPERFREWEWEYIWKAKMTQHGYSGVYEKEYIRKDGVIIPVEIQAFKTFDQNGEPERIWGIVRDITTRKKTEEEMFLLISAIEQAGETVVITNADAEIVYVNPVFEITTGYSRDEVLGKNPRILKSGLQSDEFYRDLWDTLTSGRTWKGRFINRRKDGSIYTDESSISPVFGDKNEIVNYIAVRRDITEKMRLEEEKQVLEGQFQQAQRMESIGRLAGGVAHDLNNLLAPILGYSELLMSSDISRQESLQAAREITSAGIKARNIVKQLLAYSRKQTLEFQPIDLNQVLRQFNRLLRRAIREDIIIGMDLDSELPVIKGDQGQIEQVAMNLAVNAQDAMPFGGHLTVTTRKRILTEDDQLPPLKEGTYASISFSDTGTGMDNDTIARIFEPFFTTKGQDKGTGLGLASVYGIVKQHKGHITVESQPNLATTFTLYFPETAQDWSGPIQEKTDPESCMGKETILVVEDTEPVRVLTELILKKYGYNVYTAESAKDAAATIDTIETLDLLLTDIIMPGKNGRELYSELHEQFPDIGVLFMSGYSEEMSSIELQAKGRVQYIQKPFSVSQLASKVRSVLNSGGTQSDQNQP